MHTVTSDTPPPPPSHTLQPPADTAAVILAGYQDCSEEAIRYLVDVERIPEDDQLILGLRQHLWERQQMLNYERILSQLLVQNTDDIASQNTQLNLSSDSASSSLHAEDDSGIGSPLFHHAHDSANIGHIAQFSTEARASKHPLCDSLITDSETTSEMDDSRVSDNTTSSDNSTLSVSMEESTDCEDENDEDEEEGDPMYTLAMLAQNNPQIACLTEELFTLLQSTPLDESLDSSVSD